MNGCLTNVFDVFVHGVYTACNHRSAPRLWRTSNASVPGRGAWASLARSPCTSRVSSSTALSRDSAVRGEMLSRVGVLCIQSYQSFIFPCVRGEESRKVIEYESDDPGSEWNQHG